MKAMICEGYGSGDDLVLSDVAKPELKTDADCVVRILASTVNDWDWMLVRGKPRLYRLLFGLLRPRWKILGAEIVGVIESVGASVTEFNHGDVVYGDVSEAGFGGYAEYACLPVASLRRVPDQLDVELAAALPHAAGLAWQSLVDVARLEQGESVLINGVGGGMGVLGAQIAQHHFGCTVTGVDKAFKLEALHWLGRADALDYERVDFTGTGQRYDVIIDAQTTRTPWRLLKALKPGGRYVSVGGAPGRLVALALIGPVIGRLTRRRFHLLALKPNQGLDEVETLVLAKEIEPRIDKRFALSDLPLALQRFGRSEHIGKIVILPK
ncbi:hypothetical protein BGP77_04130 [Saccharospirillum sp. MSK14-1]|uniref:NAD(P)-dependent alcohol dehydrogenase n=1 Tax=Saccharospirillum sp. MSK14-1 TaxID=1897632 RepID=UPI000D331B40|nr:NAD(P)-dependent alcohol dehydrogenase [Saccharospirillum sp. MSK14-1]PTY36494.1 hypothetical protein BGP77_04130 [Saccharospirillum sp. MSK14-1]